MIETKKHEPIVYRVYDFLKGCIGETNAVKGCDLAGAFNISERQLRNIINTIRNSTELTHTVGSSVRGYFICKDKEEFNRVNNTLFATAFDLLATARANAKKAGLDGQGRIKIGKYYKDFIEAFGE